MALRSVIPAFLFVLATSAQILPRSEVPIKLAGRDVTITEPELEDERFPKGPASVCLEGPPRRQCYTAPPGFGFPTAEVVELEGAKSVLFFWVATGGVSGWKVHFALLEAADGKDLKNLFPDQLSVSNHEQHAFWTAPEISDTPIFVTADLIWGPGETHWEPHRYTISAYVRRTSDEAAYYSLDDQYMSAGKYQPHPEPDTDILDSEKREILARLKRAKAAR
jgi:hypothetical protein